MNEQKYNEIKNLVKQHFEYGDILSDYNYLPHNTDQVKDLVLKNYYNQVVFPFINGSYITKNGYSPLQDYLNETHKPYRYLLYYNTKYDKKIITKYISDITTKIDHEFYIFYDGNKEPENEPKNKHLKCYNKNLFEKRDNDDGKIKILLDIISDFISALHSQDFSQEFEISITNEETFIQNAVNNIKTLIQYYINKKVNVSEQVKNEYSFALLNVTNAQISFEDFVNQILTRPAYNSIQKPFQKLFFQ